MVRRNRGVTILEVVVVTAIAVILMSIVVPVFTKAKHQARQTVCLSNFRQAVQATFLYQSDYNDTYMLSKYTAEAQADSRTDRTWVQLVLPYGRNFSHFTCPADFTHPTFQGQGVFNEDIVPGDTFSRYYSASMRSNIGFNYVYLAPVLEVEAGVWMSVPRMTSAVENPSSSLLFGDSVWSVTANGRPEGGGHFLILPPCRFEQFDGEQYDTFGLDHLPATRIFQADLRWDEAWFQGLSAGGLWPWHDGRLTVAFTDGGMRSVTVKSMTAGCNVQPDWSGAIVDTAQYVWDLR